MIPRPWPLLKTRFQLLTVAFKSLYKLADLIKNIDPWAVMMIAESI